MFDGVRVTFYSKDIRVQSTRFIRLKKIFYSMNQVFKKYLIHFYQKFPFRAVL